MRKVSLNIPDANQALLFRAAVLDADLSKSTNHRPGQALQIAQRTSGLMHLLKNLKIFQNARKGSKRY